MKEETFYQQRTRCLKELSVFYKANKTPKSLTAEQREVLYYNYFSGKEKNFRISKSNDACTSSALLASFNEALNKAIDFAKDNKLVCYSFTFDYWQDACISVHGYLEKSDKDLFDLFVKYCKKQESYKKASKQAHPSNKAEALKEVNRLKKKFNLDGKK